MILQLPQVGEIWNQYSDSFLIKKIDGNQIILHNLKRDLIQDCYTSAWHFWAKNQFIKK